MNSFKLVRAFQIELEFGKTGVPGQKPLGAMERTNNNLNPHMASTPGFEHGPHWWATAPSLLPKKHYIKILLHNISIFLNIPFA